MTTLPSWLCQFPVTDASRHAVDILHNALPPGQPFLDVVLKDGQVQAPIQLSEAQIAGALSLMMTAAFQYRLMHDIYVGPNGALSQHEPPAMLEALNAFHDHTGDTLRLYVHGHLHGSQLSGTVRIFP